MSDLPREPVSNAPAEGAPIIDYRMPDTEPPLDGLERYNRVADRVGFVPSLRLWDNLIQLICAIVLGSVGYIVGLSIGNGRIAILCGIAGVIVAVLISGAVIGIVRFFQRKRK